MSLIYDTASAQVMQVVKMDVSPDIIPIEIDKNLKSTTPTTQDPYYLNLFVMFLKTHNLETK